MKLDSLKIELILFLVCAATPCARCQGTFQNLDFESANIQPGTPPGTVFAASDALPGWTCYIGANQVAGVAYDTVAINDALISIHDAGSSYAPVLGGKYSVYLQPNNPVVTIFPAIAQVGTIPSGARSLEFYDKSGIPTVLFAGQQLALVTLATTPDYKVFGADVTAFAGQTGELRFTGGPLLDNIAFTSQSIPEPSVFAGLILGAGAFALSRKGRGR